MMQLALLICILFSQKDDIPYKAKEEFEIKLDLAFKQRTRPNDFKTIVFDGNQSAKQPVEGLLPTLRLQVKILTAHENEVKLRVIKDDATIVYNKKVTPGMEFILDLGFTDDLKDHVEGYKHVIGFYSSEKKNVSKIVIEFDEEGNYFVNGEKLGKV